MDIKTQVILRSFNRTKGYASAEWIARATKLSKDVVEQHLQNSKHFSKSKIRGSVGQDVYYIRKGPLTWVKDLWITFRHNSHLKYGGK